MELATTASGVLTTKPFPEISYISQILKLFIQYVLRVPKKVAVVDASL